MQTTCPRLLPNGIVARPGIRTGVGRRVLIPSALTTTPPSHTKLHTTTAVRGGKELVSGFRAMTANEHKTVT